MLCQFAVAETREDNFRWQAFERRLSEFDIDGNNQDDDDDDDDNDDDDDDDDDAVDSDSSDEGSHFASAFVDMVQLLGTNEFTTSSRLLCYLAVGQRSLTAF